MNNADLLNEPPEDLPAAWAEPADQGQEVRPRALKLGEVFAIMFELSGPLMVVMGISLLSSVHMFAYGIIWIFRLIGIIILTLGLFFHMVRFFMCEKDIDPGQVMEFLRLMREERFDHIRTAEIIEGLRPAPLQISLKGDASHELSRSSGNSYVSETVTTWSKEWYFRYASWRDVSGPIAGLDRYDYVILAVEVELVPADERTKEAIERARQDILDYIKETHKDDKMTCKQVLNVAYDKLNMEGMEAAEVQAVAVPITVMCPEGASEGQQIQFQITDGRTIMVSVPPGVSPGQQFQVQVPAAPAEATVVGGSSYIETAFETQVLAPLMCFCTESKGKFRKISDPKIIMTCRPGVKPAFFMHPRLYYICILLCLGPLYWIIFFMYTKRMVYCLRKEISIGTDAMQVPVPSSKSETNANPGSSIEITSQTCSATTYGAKA